MVPPFSCEFNIVLVQGLLIFLLCGVYGWRSIQPGIAQLFIPIKEIYKPLTKFYSLNVTIHDDANGANDYNAKALSIESGKISCHFYYKVFITP